MSFSTWLSSRARLASVALLTTSLLGCPLAEDSPDGGTPPRGDMDVACTLEYAPVCGADGVTYGNACAAGLAGVRVVHSGQCVDGGPPGLPCGGEYGETCPVGYYCDLSGDAADPAFIPVPWDAGPAPGWDAGVLPSDGGPAAQDAAPLPYDGGGGAPPPPPPGVCRPLEEPGCPNVDALVCGSNGITYQNRCVAESMGATVVSEGRCPPDGHRACGGWVGNTCAEGEYCYFEPETWCDYADASGVCVARPEVCTRELNEVCGCDGQTYANPCVAAANGTSVATYGACGGSEPGPGEEGATCGGLLGLGCNDGLYCSFPVDTACGSGDQTGTCAARPDACYDVWAPVCGCDGNIYGNDCEAAAAGVSEAPTSSCL